MDNKKIIEILEELDLRKTAEIFKKEIGGKINIYVIPKKSL